MSIFAESDHVESWKNEIRSYSEAKKKTAWDHVESPKKVTHREVKAKQVEFDPILQVFNRGDKVFLSMLF